MPRKNSEANKMTSPFKYLVIRAVNTYIYSVVISLIPLVICTAYLTETATTLIVSAVGMPLMFLFTYIAFWGTAERDRNLVLFGHIKEDKNRALRAAVYTAVPLAVLTLLAVANTYVPFLPNMFTVVYRICTLPFIFFVNAATTAASPFSWLLILICAYMPFAAWLGYYNGYNLIRLMDRLVYKQKPREKDKRLR
ncbi:MAG: hypothetical protein VB111_12735 [Clostridiaceae bacterium]|nr:hypothetical protein [Clostridiaceae bacterium]